MSQWDFGYGREPSEHHEPQYAEAQYPEAQYPQQRGPEYGAYSYPAEAHYPAAQQPAYGYAPPAAETGWPGEAPWAGAAAPGSETGWAGEASWPGAAGVADEAGWPGAPGWSDDAGWPPADGYQGTEPFDGPSAPYPITYERDEFEGRAARPALPPTAFSSLTAPTAPYAPWPDAADPTRRLSGGQPSARLSGGQPSARLSGAQPAAPPWTPPPPSGQRDATDPTRVLQSGPQPLFLDGDEPGGGYLGFRSRSRRGDRRGQRDDTWQQDDYALQQGGPDWPADAPARHQRGGPWPDDDQADWDDDPDRGRWMIPAALAVAGAAVGAAAVMFALGHARPAAPATTPSTTGGTATSQARTGTGPTGGTGTGVTGGTGTAPLTLAAAKSVLAGYTTANNLANTRRSATTLAGVETGGSYAIDAGLYPAQAAAGTAYATFAPATATYYIPRSEPAGGPRWFAVKVGNAFTANPGKITSTEYLVFTQAAAGGAWQNAIEPYLVTGANAPQVAVGGDGLATAVSGSAALAAPPAQLAAQTAAVIDGTGNGVTINDPGALADRSAETFWRGRLPKATVTDAHTAANGAEGQTFALLTTDGGALVFYTDAAQLTIAPPAGSALHLTVPGLYSPTQALSRAGLGYLDQFAAADPPATAGTPTVVAEYSGLAGKN